ncbi:MAG: polysaccharide deacetylase family protein [Lachnospiraceae bacterium]|nr:polysaccharide deacetylase family protein [Lachnospiraceae bacterium]
MAKWTVVLKIGTLFVWLTVMVAVVTFLTQGIKEEQSLLNASGKKTETSGQTTKKIKEGWEEKAESTDTEESLSKEEKYAYLTFDDGPSDNTDKILSILKEKDVKATFFVVGKTDEKSKERYCRIVEEGHSLGMHSYSHDYSYIYGSLEHYKEDLMRLHDYLYEVTGEKVKLYRFPGGSSNSVAKIPIQSCIRFLEKKGFVYYDWNASSEDAVLIGTPCETLNQNILKDALLYHNTIILMHDLYECAGTVEGLGALIDRLREEGYELKSITLETVPVQHVKDTPDK